MSKVFQPGSIRHRVLSKRILGRGYGSFLLGNTLSGLQEMDGVPSALSGNGLGMGMSMPSMGRGMSQINHKLEKLMVKASSMSKPKPRNIKFNI